MPVIVSSRSNRRTRLSTELRQSWVYLLLHATLQQHGDTGLDGEGDLSATEGQVLLQRLPIGGLFYPGLCHVKIIRHNTTQQSNGLTVSRDKGTEYTGGILITCKGLMVPDQIRHTDTDTHTHTHTHTCARRGDLCYKLGGTTAQQMYTRKQAHIHIDIHTCTHTHTDTYSDTHTFTYRHTLAHTQASTQA